MGRMQITNTCEICGKEVQVQIFKHQGYCSENCRKKRDENKEIDETQM